MFSNAQDGSRLETLYSCCADFGPLLLLFKAQKTTSAPMLSRGRRELKPDSLEGTLLQRPP